MKEGKKEEGALPTGEGVVETSDGLCEEQVANPRSPGIPGRLGSHQGDGT